MLGKMFSYFVLFGFVKFWPQIPETKQTWRNAKKYNFLDYHSFGNSQSCITAVKWDAYDLGNTAGNARRCHPDCHPR